MMVLRMTGIAISGPTLSGKGATPVAPFSDPLITFDGDGVGKPIWQGDAAGHRETSRQATG